MTIKSRSLKKSIVFVGMMGSGKTTVARCIAKAFRVPFVDTDREIERKTGQKISEIFAAHGETHFRSLEKEAILESLRTVPSSIAVGGGAYLCEVNRQLIDDLAVSVWLRAEAFALWNRVKRESKRPLLQTENPRETLIRLNRERTPFYQMASIHVNSDDTVVKTVTVQKVTKALLAAPKELQIFDND